MTIVFSVVGEPIEHVQQIRSKHVSLLFKHADGSSQKKKLPGKMISAFPDLLNTYLDIL